MAEAAPGAKKGISQKTIIIIIVILILLSGGGYAAYYYLWGPGKEKKKLKEKAEEIKKKEELESKGDSPHLEDHTKPNPTGDESWPLKKGSVGERVLYIKRAVNRLLPVGYAKVTEDTTFDPALYAALITKFGTRFYPVTEDIWTELMKKSNSLVK